MTSSWTPTDGLEAQVAEALRGEGIVASSYHEAINQLLVTYLGYKGAYSQEVSKRGDTQSRIGSLDAEREGYRNAYEEEVAKRSGLFGRISSLEAERDGYKKAYDEEVAGRSAVLGRISSLEAERDGYKKAYDEEVAGRSEMLGRISSLEAERDGYKKAYDEEVAGRSAVLGRISSLEAERDGYKKAYDEEVAGRSAVFGRISSLEAERDGYRQAYQTTLSQLERARQRQASSAATDDAPPGPRRPPPLRKSAVVPSASSASEPPMSQDHEFDRLVLAGRAAERNGQLEQAIASYIAAMRLMHRYGPAKVEADRIAKDLFQEALKLRGRDSHDESVARMVRALELNPESQEVRDNLQSLLDERPGRDLTQECLIFPDAARATRFYRHAIQTCMDFVVHGGVEGEIMEFGVLGGWTARHFAEISRDMAYYGDLMLFDSFAGLPRMKGEVDRASYDVTRGIWREEMALPKSWEDELGATIDEHIRAMLSQVISPSRIKVRKGFYSDTLRAPLGAKAALVHMDCDLYQSTVEVFAALERDAALQDGTIIMFDDWNCNRANPAFGQRRAFREFLERNKGRWETSHYLNYGFNCAAFILHKMGA